MNTRKLSDQYVEIEHPYFDQPSDPLVHAGERREAGDSLQLDWRQVVGGVSIAIGVAMLIMGWVGVSGTKNTYEQLSYFSSAGLGGAAAVIIGATILVTYEHYTDRQTLNVLDSRLAQMERRLSGELTSLSDTLSAPSKVRDYQAVADQLPVNGKSHATAARRRG